MSGCRQAGHNLVGIAQQFAAQFWQNVALVQSRLAPFEVTRERHGLAPNPRARSQGTEPVLARGVRVPLFS